MLRCNGARGPAVIALLLLFVRIAGATCDVDPAGTPCADDGNPCSLDVCDGHGTCVHPTGGQAACDDGNPCTIDDVCGDGVCAGTVVPGSCIDAALCYRTRAEAGFSPATLTFVDGISISGGRPRQPVDLCLPARTDGGATIAPAISLASYRIRGGASPSPRPFTITDQFGTRRAGAGGEPGAFDELLPATVARINAVDEVTTFTGTPFSIDPAPPPQAQYEPLLTFPPDAPGDLAGLLQGVAIQFGAGRVYVSGESGGLTAQTGFGMQDTPDNEQFLRNVVHWLDS